MNALLCSYGSCSKSFGESTPSREACRAHQSQNDLEQLSPERQGAARAARRAERRAEGGSGRRRGKRRLCPRETHGRPWPCEWVARRHCVKRRGERQMSLRPGVNAVASDGMERSGRFRRAAACACRWWQRGRPGAAAAGRAAGRAAGQRGSERGTRRA